MSENPAHSLSSIDVDTLTILEPAADVDALMQSHNDNIPLLPITSADRSTPPYPSDIKDALIQPNENNSPSQPPRTKHWRKGWWAGVRIFAILTTCIFALNLIITIYMLAKYGTGNAGSVVVYKGQCKKTQTYSLWLHFAINAISTGLLAAGNYTMQALISPTRGEINKSHKNNDWVEIGVISFRNLRRISMDRVVLWWLLALSSVPLHLLFNSVVFTTVATNAYTGVVAPESFLVQPSYTMPDDCTYGCNSVFGSTMFNDRVKYIHTHANSFKRLEKIDCIRAYGQSFITTHHDLVLVTSNNSLTVSGDSGGEPVVIPFEIYFHTNVNNARFYSWICGPEVEWCDIRNVIDKVKSLEWRVEDQPIEYCLAESVPEQCTLNFNTSIMIATLMCNIIKAVCMYCALFRYKRTGPSVLLTTLGDAAESFLRSPDETTTGLCTASKKTFCDKTAWVNLPRPQQWTDEQYRWFHAAPRKLWVSATVVTLLGILVTGTLLALALVQLSEALHSIPGFAYLIHLGVGTPSAFTLVDSRLIPSTTISIIILANLPQTIYSLLYLSYNAILTRMFASLEWSKYSTKYAGLRTSWAQGQQRSTLLLQLPYHYAIPFMVLSLLLHWMISSSLFFVKARVFVHGVEQVYTGGDNRGNKTFETLGYSPIAIIVSMFLAAVMMAAVLGHARRRYRPGMPFAAACSAAISAACHAEHGDAIFDKMVKWGDVNETGDVGHCTFGVANVHGLEKGKLYA